MNLEVGEKFSERFVAAEILQMRKAAQKISASQEKRIAFLKKVGVLDSAAKNRTNSKRTSR